MQSNKDEQHRQAAKTVKAIFGEPQPLHAENSGPLSSPVCIWQTFRLQQQAFDFVDSLPQQQRNHVRVYSQEVGLKGTRQFLVASQDSLWKQYNAISPDERHFYEIIRAGQPCHLYFDLEYDRAANPGVDGNAQVMLLVHEVAALMKEKLGVTLNPDRHVIELDSTTPTKWSRHLIFQLKRAWAHAGHLHAFVSLLLQRLLRHARHEKGIDMPGPSSGEQPQPNPQQQQQQEPGHGQEIGNTEQEAEPAAVGQASGSGTYGLSCMPITGCDGLPSMYSCSPSKQAGMETSPSYPRNQTYSLTSTINPLPIASNLDQQPMPHHMNAPLHNSGMDIGEDPPGTAGIMAANTSIPDCQGVHQGCPMENVPPLQNNTFSKCNVKHVVVGAELEFEPTSDRATHSHMNIPSEAGQCNRCQVGTAETSAQRPYCNVPGATYANFWVRKKVTDHPKEIFADLAGNESELQANVQHSACAVSVSHAAGTSLDTGSRPMATASQPWPASEDLVLMIDTGVYTRNRAFRIYLSSKHGKDVYLRATRRFAVTSFLADCPDHCSRPASTATARPSIQQPLTKRAKTSRNNLHGPPDLLSLLSTPIITNPTANHPHSRPDSHEKLSKLHNENDQTNSLWPPLRDTTNTNCPHSIQHQQQPAKGNTCAKAVGMPVVELSCNPPGTSDASSNQQPLLLSSGEELLVCERIFWSSLVTHTSHCSTLKPLTMISEDEAPMHSGVVRVASLHGQQPKLSIHHAKAGQILNVAPTAAALEGSVSKPVGVVRPGSTPWPSLNAYVAAMTAQVGPPGSVSGWSITDTGNPNRPISLMLRIRGNRYCGNVGRQHKSNGVYWSVCVASGEWVQRCFDADCRHYRSPVMPLPVDVWQILQSDLLDLIEGE